MVRNLTVRAREEALRQFATHVMTEAPTRSFKFKRDDGRSPFWFTLTWTPGHLALSGDLGELTLVHYHALQRFDGISWALSADHEYLMSKTSVKRVYDADLTLRDLRRMLGEGAVEALNGRRGYRGVKDERGAYTTVLQRTPGYRQEMHAYRRDMATAAISYANAMAEWENSGAGEMPELEDFTVEQPEDPRAFRRKARWRDAHSLVRHNAPLDEVWSIPDCWNGWVRVWRKLRGSSYSAESSDEHPAYVTKAMNRRELIDEVRDELEEPGRAAEFLSSIGMSDYYGTYVWDEHTYWQIAAIQHGVKLILGSVPADGGRHG